MKMLSIGPLLIGAFVVLSIAAVAGGFLVIGTPGEQRMIALDKQRIGDLRRLARAVGAYWETHGELPPRLSDIDNDWVPQAADPESGQPYTYQVTGPKAYQLCADFARADDEPAKDPREQRFSTHPAGHHCFELRLERGERFLHFPPA